MSGLDNIRLSESAKSHLSTLKSRTGIRQWNILCRWAFCVSLAEKMPPSAEEVPADSNVEMTWRTFAGAGDEDLYRALLKAFCIRNRIPVTEEELARQFRRHLHRGINYLASSKIRSLADLLALAKQQE